MDIFGSVILPAIVSAVISFPVAYFLAPSMAAQREKGRAARESANRVMTEWRGLGTDLAAAEEVAADPEDEPYVAAMSQVDSRVDAVNSALLSVEGRRFEAMRPLLNDCKAAAQSAMKHAFSAYGARGETLSRLAGKRREIDASLPRR